MISEEDLKCSICSSLMKHAIVTNCGHSFCANCILEHSEKSKKCPMCRSKIFDLHPSFLLRNLIEKKDTDNSSELGMEEKQELDEDIKNFNENNLRPTNLPSLLLYDFNILKRLMTKFNNIFALLGWSIIVLLIVYLLWTDDLIPLSFGLIGLADDIALILLAFTGLHFVVKYFEQKIQEKYIVKKQKTKDKANETAEKNVHTETKNESTATKNVQEQK
ncbi:e3 ubiquitin-protein ligase [Anaeramoeba flamelloides]|uniref:E3 ubiquitin-protein ligase n=1 Tax=Anaeramoeba flamelloides TaxID=1746091 RepID=A0AAV7YLA9_9EUKA|nr:e3 ubiquitin-protein ligase [Anaeramoeba flamelloides]KAJ6249175.1 e3 ubiquitin-protein ligase [Anaeramoeba flamelloides]